MNDIVVRSTNVPASFAEQMEMARVFATSTLLPAHLRGKPENILVILDGARALDVPSFWAFQSMYVVEGKLALSAELMRALVVRAGHRFRILDHSSQVARVAIVRKDDPDYTFESEFTLDDARQAGLTGKGPWKNYPKAMLLARATSQAVRALCSDVLFGVVYTPEELGALVDDEGKPVVDNTGRVVIDSTATDMPAITPDQVLVDKSIEALTTEPLADAMNAYALADRMKLLAEQHSMDPTRTLRQAWLERLANEADTAPSVEELRLVWKCANAAGLLAQPDPNGVRLGELIENRKKDLESAPVDAEIVEDPKTQDPEADTTEAQFDAMPAEAGPVALVGEIVDGTSDE